MSNHTRTAKAKGAEQECHRPRKILLLRPNVSREIKRTNGADFSIGQKSSLILNETSVAPWKASDPHHSLARSLAHRPTPSLRADKFRVV